MANRVFLLCFKSCLKGDDNSEYYTVLGFRNPSEATVDEVKKAYKKISLTLHPDKLAQRGIAVTQEHKQQFLKAKEAYDVLSDPRRKKLYDELGASGMKLLESPSEVNPVDLLKNFQKNKRDRFSIFLLIAIIFASIIILPILFSLKCDNEIKSAPWVAIWTPMWIFDGITFASAVVLFCMNTTPKPKKEKSEATDEDDEDDDASIDVPFSSKVFNFVTKVLFILIQIFVLIRLDHFTHWSWFGVFAPWFIHDFLYLVSNIPTAISKVDPPVHDDKATNAESGDPEEAAMKYLTKEAEYQQKYLEIYESRIEIVSMGLRFWQAFFLAAQLDHRVHWNWGLVFLPIWIYLALHICVSMDLRQKGKQILGDIDEIAVMEGQDTRPESVSKVNRGRELLSMSTMQCVAQISPIIIFILLVSRLQVTYISTFLIIIPIFIIAGCCCCFVFCFLCCLSNVDPDAMGEGFNAGMQGKDYSPPDYSEAANPIVVTPEPVQENYGSFNSSSQPAEVKKEESAVAATTIDVDID